MLEEILPWERDLFLLLNSPHTPFFDNFMWLYSQIWSWLPFYIVLFGILVYKKTWKESLLIIAAIILLVLLCDQISSHICKPYFHRFRPTHHPDFENIVKTVFGYRGGSYGFISGHATNSFGFAVFLSLVFRNKYLTFILFLFASINAYSRIYLGVHFISDIVAGAIVGSIIGFLVYKLYMFARKKFLKNPRRGYKPLLYTPQQSAILIITYLILVFCYSFFGEQIVELVRGI